MAKQILLIIYLCHNDIPIKNLFYFVINIWYIIKKSDLAYNQVIKQIKIDYTLSILVVEFINLVGTYFAKNNNKNTFNFN